MQVNQQVRLTTGHLAGTEGKVIGYLDAKEGAHSMCSERLVTVNIGRMNL
jgi:hypothetical protein